MVARCLHEHANMFCFVPVFAWMSRRDFAWQAELFFLCSPPGVASLKGGTVVSLLGCISLFILFCGMRVQIRNVLQLACQPLFQIGNQTQFFCQLM